MQVAANRLRRSEIGGIGQEGNFAVEEFRRRCGILIESSGEPVSNAIGLDEAGKVSLRNGSSETAVGPRSEARQPRAVSLAVGSQEIVHPKQG